MNKTIIKRIGRGQGSNETVEVLARNEIENIIDNLELIDIIKEAYKGFNKNFKTGYAIINLETGNLGYDSLSFNEENQAIDNTQIILYSFDQNFDISDLELHNENGELLEDEEEIEAMYDYLEYSDNLDLVYISRQLDDFYNNTETVTEIHLNLRVKEFFNKYENEIIDIIKDEFKTVIKFYDLVDIVDKKYDGGYMIKGYCDMDRMYKTEYYPQLIKNKLLKYISISDLPLEENIKYQIDIICNNDCITITSEISWYEPLSKDEIGDMCNYQGIYSKNINFINQVDLRELRYSIQDCIDKIK